LRDARLTFSRASVARSRRVRARVASRDACFSDRRVSPRESVARESRVARRRAMTRARRDATHMAPRHRHVNTLPNYEKS